MPFACLVYNASAAAAGATNTDFTAATDPDFTGRNGHYTFTEQYSLLAAAAVGASVTRGRFQNPTWNAIGEFTIFNANRSLQPPANPQYDLYFPAPPAISPNEEFQVQMSNNLGAATEIENVVLLIAPGTGRPVANIPAGRLTLCVRATFTVTPTLNAWSGPVALTFSQGLRGGTYAVVGAFCQGSNAVAFRLIFPKYKLINGRKLRPGWLTQNALGDATNQQIDPWVFAMGEWGRFFTFEPPQAEVFGTAAAGTTYQLFLWLVYLGEADTSSGS